MFEHIDLAITASILAGQRIMEVYNSNNFEIEFKQDQSLLTKADKLSHSTISEILSKTKLPILSEEGKEIEYCNRKKWKMFWLVDPIDGTKEFVNRNGEFTVNIALIKDNKPVGGVIYVPVSQELYVGVNDYGAFKLQTNNQSNTFMDVQEQGLKLPIRNDRNDYIIVGSRSFMNEETKTYIGVIKKEYPDAQMLSKGSSLKICMVAEGKADIYPRFGPTMEWDTAAGHAIIKAAGKNLYIKYSKNELAYNKKVLLNPYFIAE